MVSKSLLLDAHTVVAHWKLVRARWINTILKMFGMGRKVLSGGEYDLLRPTHDFYGQQYSRGYALAGPSQGFTFRF